MSLEKEIIEIKEKALELLSSRSEAEIQEALGYAPALAALLFNVMHLRCNEPHWEDRDRLICPAMPVNAVCAAALAQRGFAGLPPAAGAEGLFPGMDAAAGKAGQGMTLAVNSALKARNDIKIYRSYLILTQADCLTGELWEQAINASENMLEDLTLILCRSRSEILPGLDNICAKFSAFGFDTFSVDGSSADAVSLALLLPRRSHRPAFICCEF